jgi:phage shock protein E
MKNKPGIIITLMLLIAMMAPVFLGGCTYITGEVITTPTTTPTIIEVIKNVTPQEAQGLLMFSSKWVHVIDVRTPQEFAGGHISGAINTDFSATDFREKINNLEKGAAYLVYCHSGGRSAAATRVMKELGFKDIYNMTGGFSSWQAAGLPVVK